MPYRNHKMLAVLLVCCLFLNGCALLKLPLEIVKVPFTLLKQVLKVADKLPKPPPGVFF